MADDLTGLEDLIESPDPQASGDYPTGVTVLSVSTATPKKQKPNDLRALARSYAEQHGIDPDIYERQIKQESSFNPYARSKKGALGLAQFMPETGARYGLKSKRDFLDPNKSLEAGARHHADLLKKYNGNQDLVLAAYNAGEGAVDDYMNGTNLTGKNPRLRKTGGVPPFKETKAYIQAIRGAAPRGDKSADLPAENDPLLGIEDLIGEPAAIPQNTIPIQNQPLAPPEIAPGFPLGTAPLPAPGQFQIAPTPGMIQPEGLAPYSPDQMPVAPLAAPAAPITLGRQSPRSNEPVTLRSIKQRKAQMRAVDSDLTAQAADIRKQAEELEAAREAVQSGLIGLDEFNARVVAVNSAQNALRRRADAHKAEFDRMNADIGRFNRQMRSKLERRGQALPTKETGNAVNPPADEFNLTPGAFGLPQDQATRAPDSIDRARRVISSRTPAQHMAIDRMLAKPISSEFLRQIQQATPIAPAEPPATFVEDAKRRGLSVEEPFVSRMDSGVTTVDGQIIAPPPGGAITPAGQPSSQPLHVQVKTREQEQEEAGERWKAEQRHYRGLRQQQIGAEEDEKHGAITNAIRHGVDSALAGVGKVFYSVGGKAATPLAMLLDTVRPGTSEELDARRREMLQASEDLQNRSKPDSFTNRMLFAAGETLPKLAIPGGPIGLGLAETIGALGEDEKPGEAIKRGLTAAATAQLGGFFGGKLSELARKPVKAGLARTGAEIGEKLDRAGIGAAGKAADAESGVLFNLNRTGQRVAGPMEKYLQGAGTALGEKAERIGSGPFGQYLSRAFGLGAAPGVVRYAETGKLPDKREAASDMIFGLVFALHGSNWHHQLDLNNPPRYLKPVLEEAARLMEGAGLSAKDAAEQARFDYQHGVQQIREAGITPSDAKAAIKAHLEQVKQDITQQLKDQSDASAQKQVAAERATPAVGDLKIITPEKAAALDRQTKPFKAEGKLREALQAKGLDDARIDAMSAEDARQAIWGEGAKPEPAAIEAVKPEGVDTAAHEAATSPKNDLSAPTDAQIEAGNYKKGHTRIAGLDVAIENPQGSKRRLEWPPLESHYGYLRRTTGADSEQLDVFVKPGTPADYDGPVYVVDQAKRNGKFDEHKIMLGFPDEAAARAGYAENYTKGWKVGPITEFASPVEFREWLKTADTKKPASEFETKAPSSRVDVMSAPQGRPSAPTAGSSSKINMLEAPQGREASPGVKRLIRDKRTAERAADTDALTGVQSARAFQTAKPHVDADPNREWVTIDLNNFKDVNDFLGHSEGDVRLKKVGDAMNAIVAKNMRAQAYRSGGDEFSFAVTKGHGAAVARQIEQAIGAETLPSGRVFSLSATSGATYNEADRKLEGAKAARKSALGGVQGPREEKTVAEIPVSSEAAKPTTSQPAAASFKPGETVQHPKYADGAPLTVVNVGDGSITVKRVDGKGKESTIYERSNVYKTLTRVETGAAATTPTSTAKPGPLAKSDEPGWWKELTISGKFQVLEASGVRKRGQKVTRAVDWQHLTGEEQQLLDRQWGERKIAPAEVEAKPARRPSRADAIRLAQEAAARKVQKRADALAKAQGKVEAANEKRVAENLASNESQKKATESKASVREPKSPTYEPKSLIAETESTKSGTPETPAKTKRRALIESLNDDDLWGEGGQPSLAPGALKPVALEAAEYAPRQESDYIELNAAGQRALSLAFGKPAYGLTLTLSQGRTIAANARTKAASAKTATERRNLLGLADAIDRFSVGRAEFSLGKPRTFRHESQHVADKAIQRFFDRVYSAEDAQGLDEFEPFKAALVKKGYPADAAPYRFAMEAIAHVVNRQWGELGLTARQAIRFAASYYKMIARVYKPDALKRYREVEDDFRRLIDATIEKTRAEQAGVSVAAQGQGSAGAGSVLEGRREGSREVPAGQVGESALEDLAPIRFEIGRRLSPEEKREVLKSLRDSYKMLGAPKVPKGQNAHGDEILGYEYNPDYMYKSDITGRNIRQFITLPDGRKAHPSELFPNLTQTEIDKHFFEVEAEERRDAEMNRSRRARIVESGEKGLANAKYNQTRRKLDDSYFAKNDQGHIVRVDGSDPKDAAYFESLGFEPTTKKAREIDKSGPFADLADLADIPLPPRVVSALVEITHDFIESGENDFDLLMNEIEAAVSVDKFSRISPHLNEIINAVYDRMEAEAPAVAPTRLTEDDRRAAIARIKARREAPRTVKVIKSAKPRDVSIKPSDSLLSAIQKIGIDPTTQEGADFARYLSPRQGGRPGMLRKAPAEGGGKRDIDYMLTRLNESGWNFENKNELFEAVRREQAGYKVYTTSKDFDADFERALKEEFGDEVITEPSVGSLRSLIDHPETRAIIDSFTNGEYNDEDAERFEQTARYELNVPESLIAATLEDARDTAATLRADRLGGADDAQGEAVGDEPRVGADERAAGEPEGDVAAGLTTDQLDRVRALYESLRERGENIGEYLHQQGLFGDELNPAQKTALLRMSKRERRASVREEQGGLFADLAPPSPEDLADLRILATYHAENGVTGFGDFRARMLEDAGAWVEPYLHKLHANATKAETQAPAVEASASKIDPDEHFNFKRSSFASPETEAAFRRIVQNAVAKTGTAHKEPVSREQHMARVGDLSPDLLPEISRLRESQIVSREVFTAASEYAQTLTRQAQDMRGEITPATDFAVAASKLEKIAALEADATEIMGHVVGVRSEFGRNLALLAAQKTDQLAPEKVLAFGRKLAELRGLELDSQTWKTSARKLVGASNELQNAQAEKARIRKERQKVKEATAKPAEKRESWQAQMVGRLQSRADEALKRLAGRSEPLADLEPKQTETEEFKRWFGESKVVDERGEPLVVYHGTGSDFTSFDIKKAGSARGDKSERAFFFSSDTETSNHSADVSGGQGGANVIPAYLKIEKPYISRLIFYNSKKFAEEIKAAKSAGHDGIIFPDLTYGGENGTFAVFYPTQIKSAVGNIGTFDPNNPDILADLAPDTDAYDIATVLAARVAEESAKKQGLPLDRLVQQLRDEFPETVSGREDDIKLTADTILKQARREALLAAARRPAETLTARRELASEAMAARRAVKNAERESETKRRQIEKAWERDAVAAGLEAAGAWDKAAAASARQQSVVDAELSQAERDAEFAFRREQRQAVIEEAKRARKAEMLNERARLDAIADDAREEAKRAREAVREAIKAGSGKEARERRAQERREEARKQRWDYPITEAASAARARIEANPGYQPTVEDLAAILSVKGTEAGMTTTRLHREMEQEFGDPYTKRASQIRDAAAEMRGRARESYKQRVLERRAAGKAEGATKPVDAAQARRDYQEWAAERLRELAEEEAYQTKREQAAKRDMAREFAKLQKPSKFDTLLDALSLPISLKASIDLPFLRQGIIPAVTHPVLTLKALMVSLGTWSEAQMDRKVDALEQHDLADLARLSGLKQSSVETRRAPLSRLAREEQYQNRFAQMFPHVRVSERQYTIGMDSLRLSLFERFAALMLKTFPSARYPEVYEALATQINIWTGVGDLGAITKYTPALNRLAWSTRLIASRIQFLGDPLRWSSMPPPVRRIAMRHWAQFMGSMVGLFLLAAVLGLTSLDPDDEDFLKLHIPGTNQRWDVTGGMAQYVRLMLKLTRSVWRKATHQREFENDGIIDNLLRFGRGKLAPAAAAIVDYKTGKTYTGEPLPTPTERALDAVTPMIGRDIYDAVRLDGWRGLGMVPFGLLGGSSSTYRTKKDPQRTGSEAERYAQGFARQKLGDKPETLEEFKRRTAISEYVSAKKTGKPTAGIVADIEKSGGAITDKEKEKIDERLSESPLKHAYEGLSGDEKEEVLNVATPAERAAIEPAYENIKERLDALRQGEEFKSMTPPQKTEAVRGIFKQERAAQKKNPGETETERDLRRDKTEIHERILEDLKTRGDFNELDKEGQEYVTRGISTYLNRFDITTRDRKYMDDAERAQKAAELIERMHDRGSFNDEIERLIERARRRAA